jgi:hypothetical protein
MVMHWLFGLLSQKKPNKKIKKKKKKKKNSLNGDRNWRKPSQKWSQFSTGGPM